MPSAPQTRRTMTAERVVEPDPAVALVHVPPPIPSEHSRAWQPPVFLVHEVAERLRTVLDDRDGTRTTSYHVRISGPVAKADGTAHRRESSDRSWSTDPGSEPLSAIPPEIRALLAGPDGLAF